MEIILKRCAGLDVHKRIIVVCVLLVGDDWQVTKHVREFRTMTRDILELGDWLKQLDVTHVAMESTGVFWKPIYNLLDGSFEILLVNAQHIKNVPGRKTDVKDSEWIARCLQHGLLRASFVPKLAIRELRDLTRHRAQLASEKTREANRIHKILEDANIKLGSVATDIMGASGRDMIRHLIAGENDPAKLAELARRKLRGKIPDLKLALEGNMNDHRRFMLKTHFDHVEYIESVIEQLTRRVEQIMEPQQPSADPPPRHECDSSAPSPSKSLPPPSYDEAMAILDSAPGVDTAVAQAIVAELGLDMSQFPSDRHLCAWAGLSPGNNESAGKRKSGKTTKGSRWLRRSLCQAAWASVRSKDTYLCALFHRLAARRGKKRAIVAVAHSLLVSIYHMLTTHTCYQELGAHWFERQHPERLKRYYIKRLEALGHTVVLLQDSQTPNALASA